ncbi:MAG: ferritin family protein [Betaproteobacteria bacterium]|nr:ferritin family protein [Betaproteobacteria bacterium]
MSQPETRKGGALPEIKSVDELMRYAYAMEAEAAERYADFADIMETHNNREVAELFRKLARIEGRHSEQVLETMGWKTPPTPPEGGYRWERLSGPESGEPEELHYLMQPYHALQIALHNEKRAYDFFRRLGQTAPVELRQAVKEMETDEAEHVALIQAWLDRTAKPEANWADDPDPPVWND